MINVDIVIIGLGLTAKLTALALAKISCKIVIIGEENESINSNLVTFFSSKSIRFLNDLGLTELSNQSVNISEISCSKLSWYKLKKKFQMNFKKDNNNELGRIIQNKELHQSLNELITKNSDISIINSTNIRSHKYINNINILTIENNIQINSKLILIADNKCELINKYFPNNSINNELNQTSIVVNTKVNTKNHAYQFFTEDGALALLPITKDTASIIWSLDNDSEILKLDENQIFENIKNIFNDIFTQIEFLEFQKYRLKFNFAKETISESIVLIGDAAHSLHPIAGQGLNLTIKDIETLIDKLSHFMYIGYELGNPFMLNDYQQARQADNTIYTFTTNYLDKILKNNNILVNTISNLGISYVEKSKLIKKLLVRSASG